LYSAVRHYETSLVFTSLGAGSLIDIKEIFSNNILGKGKGKTVPLQARIGTEGSRKLSFPDFVTTAQDGGRLSALRTGRLYPYEILLIIISFRG
jgi:hypothetical protein